MKSVVSMFMVLVVLMASFMMTGCNTTSSSLVTALNAVSDASSVAVVVTQSLVAVGKLDPAVANQVSEYASGVSSAVQVSVAELKSSDANAQKITVISAAFAKVAAPAIASAAGANSQQIVAAIDAVTVTIKIFLNQLTSAGVLKMAAAAPHAKIFLAPGDKAMLKQIQKKTAATLASAVALKK